MAIRQWHRIIRVNQFVRHKHVSSAQEIPTFAPEQAQKWMKTRIEAAWKIVDFDNVVLIAKFLVSGQAQRQGDGLGMVQFSCLHQSRSTRAREINSFSL